MLKLAIKIVCCVRVGTPKDPLASDGRIELIARVGPPIGAIEPVDPVGGKTIAVPESASPATPLAIPPPTPTRARMSSTSSQPIVAVIQTKIHSPCRPEFRNIPSLHARETLEPSIKLFP